MAEASRRAATTQAATSEPAAAIALSTLSTATPVKSPSRTHMYEVDVVRSVTALSVVGVHMVALTIILATTPAGILIQNGVVSALHFTREIFVAITSFVMVYGYANRPFSVRTFAKKRAIGVLLPYVVWSIFYELVQGKQLPPVQWILHLLGDLATGSASFQLYYILLTLEFYLIFPWFLGWIQWAGRRPWLLIGMSFALQLILMIVEYQYIQVKPFAGTPIGIYINLNQSRYLPLYQFYVVLGGVAALYIKDVRAFLLRHGGWTIVALPLTLALLVGSMVYEVKVEHQTMDFATSVFQPVMQFYVVALAAFLYWIAYRWSISRAPRPPSGHSFWQLLSNASFGMYLMQGYFITLVMADLVPNLPVQWYEPLRVALAWFAVAGPCVLLCSIMLYIPGLSRLLGHPCMLQLRRKRSEDDGTRTITRPAWAQLLGRAVTDASQLVGIRGIFSQTGLTWRESRGRNAKPAKEDSPVPNPSSEGPEGPALDTKPSVI
ncbi:MAG: acyltransferase [Ktedonobacterales bacterium]